MRKIFLLLSLALAVAARAGVPVTESGIPLDADWKVKTYEFATRNAVHVAWGRAHSERNYLLSLVLAESEGWKVDEDVLFAAAFFHDIGAIAPFRKEGVEHEPRSVEVMLPLLRSYGFPERKLAAVRDVVLEHMYYHESAPRSRESKVFHDADALDFLGEIGIVRIVALSSIGHAWAPDLPGAIHTLQGWMGELPPKLATESAKRLASARIAGMLPFFQALDTQTLNGKAL